MANKNKGILIFQVMTIVAFIMMILACTSNNSVSGDSGGASTPADRAQISIQDSLMNQVNPAYDLAMEK